MRRCGAENEGCLTRDRELTGAPGITFQTFVQDKAGGSGAAGWEARLEEIRPSVERLAHLEVEAQMSFFGANMKYGIVPMNNASRG